MESQLYLTRKIANRLFLLRSERGLSLDEVAKKSGVSRSTLSRIENADVSPTAETLSALADTFETPLSRLIAMAEDSFAAYVPLEEQPEWTDPETGSTHRTVSPMSPHLIATAEESHVPPNTHLEMTVGTNPGQEIHLIVLDGEVTISLGLDEHILTHGDCLRYKDHGSMRIQTPPSRGARFLRIRA